VWFIEELEDHTGAAVECGVRGDRGPEHDRVLGEEQILANRQRAGAARPMEVEDDNEAAAQQQFDKRNELALVRRGVRVSVVETKPAIFVHREPDGVDTPRRHPVDNGFVRRTRKRTVCFGAHVLAAHHRHAFKHHGLAGGAVDEFVADSMDVWRSRRQGCADNDDHRAHCK
jgi:hypothetical protein